MTITYNVHDGESGETLEWCETERDAIQWIFDNGRPGDFVLPFDPAEQ